jgi:hypothetical protein
VQTKRACQKNGRRVHPPTTRTEDQVLVLSEREKRRPRHVLLLSFGLWLGAQAKRDGIACSIARLRSKPFNPSQTEKKCAFTTTARCTGSVLLLLC